MCKRTSTLVLGYVWRPLLGTSLLHDYAETILLGATYNPRPVLCPTNVGRRYCAVIDLAHYRCFFVDTLMALNGSEDFHADDEGGANEKVMSLFRERNYHSLGI